jgi:hypothetical protein
MSNHDSNTNLVPPDNALATEQDARFNDATDEHDLLSSGRPLSIRSPFKFKLLGWVGLFASLIFVCVGVHGRLYGGVVFYVLMACASVYLLILARSSLRVDTQGFVLVRYLSRYRIGWDEIQSIEFSSQMDRFVFYGHNKWLVVPQVAPVVSGQRKDFAKLLAVQARQRRIPISFAEVTPSYQKNTRVGF